MTLPPRLSQALARLHQGLDQIEAAVARHAESADIRVNLQEELAIMQDDRSRLAVQLDGALGRARTLELANTEVSQRLARIGGVIGHTLGQTDDIPEDESPEDDVSGGEVSGAADSELEPDEHGPDEPRRPAGAGGTAEG